MTNHPAIASGGAAVITGGANGIGLAAAKRFASFGMNVVLADLDPATARTIQDKYFRRSFTEVWDETAAYLAASKRGELERAESSPRHKMALVFRW